MEFFKLAARTALLSSVACLTPAFADTIQASFLAAGVQSPVVTNHFETFNNFPGNGSGRTTNFNGSSYTGTFSGGIRISGANIYGGAGGIGRYPVTVSSYSLSLNKGANYFGLWFSALDKGNKIEFFNGSSLLYTFTPQEFQNLVGSCPGTAFCGNPNNGGDATEQFAYLNFYDYNGAFNRIVFSQLGVGGLETDNQAVATLSAPPGGTPINTVPEPATLAAILLGTSLIAASKLKKAAPPRAEA